MVHKTFGIYNPSNPISTLNIEIGKSHVSCWQKDINSDKIFSFELFQFEKSKDESIADIFRVIKHQSEILPHTFDKVEIIWEHPQALIIPDNFYFENEQKKYLSLLFGNVFFHESECNVLEELHVAYYIDEEWKKQLSQHFASMISVHKYYKLLKEWSVKKQQLFDEYVQVLLYQNHFILLVSKQKKLQLTNTFTYQTPEDVLYHILNVCERLELNKDQTHFSFSGLIDVESNLFRTLETYLKNIFFIIPSSETLAAEGFQKYPAHYFSSFLNIFP